MNTNLQQRRNVLGEKYTKKVFFSLVGNAPIGEKN